MAPNAPLDGDTAAFLQQIVDANADPITAGTPDEARAANAAFLAQVGIDRVEIEHVADLDIPSVDGPIPARHYRPAGSPSAVVVYFHGGGWVLGDLEGHDTFCRYIADKVGVEVLNVNYRHAPEHPFPAAPDDAYTAIRYAADNLTDGRPLVVAGDSAGGNLAAVAALRARDEAGPEVAFQLLLYPVLGSDLNNEAYQRLGEGHLLLRSDMEWFFDHYVPNVDERTHPYVAPVNAEDLTGVAPAYIVVGGYDPLVEEGRAYAAKLEEAGVPVHLREYDGLIHGFMTMPKAIPSTAVVIEEVITEFGRLLTEHTRG